MSWFYPLPGSGSFQCVFPALFHVLHVLYLFEFVVFKLFIAITNISLYIAVKHSWPFNDQVIVYVRYVGPGLLIGQAWQEGAALEQVPRKLFSEILMVKDYASQVKRQ